MAKYEEEGRRLKSMRQDAQLSISDVASAIGLSEITIMNVERGRQRIGEKSKRKMEELYGSPDARQKSERLRSAEWSVNTGKWKDCTQQEIVRIVSEIVTKKDFWAKVDSLDKIIDFDRNVATYYMLMMELEKFFEEV